MADDDSKPIGAGSRRPAVFPFATIVTKDCEGFDTASNLNRPDVFRLNIALGRKRFEDLMGYPPAAHARHCADFDHSAADQLLPHPRFVGCLLG